MDRCHNVPVPELPHPFLAAVDVLELGFVRRVCAEPRQKILAASLSISSVKGIGQVIHISSTTYDSPMMSSVAFPTENISTAAELISA